MTRDPIRDAIDEARIDPAGWVDADDAAQRIRKYLLSDEAHHWRRWVTDAGLGAPDSRGRWLTLHGLRKAMGRRLAEAGASPFEIQAVLGHESIASVQVYTRMYDRAKSADSALERLGVAKPSNVTRMKGKKE